jgi:hypothetical protein
MTSLLDRAETFLWQNGRLLERRRFAFHFHNGSRADVIAALRPYQNADGGFGNALEPDIRCPQSQPVPTQHALEILDEVGGMEPAVMAQVCDWLMTVTTAAGGVPWLLPSAELYPRAPWWQTVPGLPASLNPTAAIAGLLHKHRCTHPWLAGATAFCRREIARLESAEMHELGCVFTFLAHLPDREWAEQALARLAALLQRSGLIAPPDADGYVRQALGWAPLPDHPLRRFLDEGAISADIAALIAAQQPDGGWAIAWPPLSTGCEIEWRGWVTLEKLLVLRGNHQLQGV